MMTSQISTLDEIFPDLVRYLNISNLAPHMKKAQLLTDDELERLEITPSNTCRDAVFRLLKILKRKGPGHERKFLNVLKASMEYDAHLGHSAIIEALENGLATSVTSTMGQPSTGSSSQRDDCVCSDGMFGGTLQPEFEHTTISQTNDSYRDMQHESDLRDLSYRLQQAFRDPMESRSPLKLGDIEYMDDVKRNKQDLDALKCKIVRDNSNITMTFARHVLGVYRILCRLKVSISEIRIGLRFLGCLQNAPADGNIPIYGASSDIIKAEKLEDLFDCLHNYSSWYNYGLIKFVALEFCGTDGKTLIEDYEDELRRYFENLIAYQCPQFTLDGGIPPGYEMLVVKIDRNFSTYSAQDMALFQGTISSLLNLDPKVLLLTSIEDGCVRLTFAVPSAVAGYIVREALTVKPTLKDNGVILIVAAGKYIEIGKAEEKPLVLHRVPPVMHKNLAFSDSNESCTSFISDLSSKSNSSSNSNRSSTIVGNDCVPLNETEEEILSIYSGTHSDHSISPECSHVGSPLKQTQTPENETFTRNYFSEFDLLADTEATPVVKGNTIRAMSMPNCEMVGIDELCTGSRKRSRSYKAKKVLLSPLKLLPKFMRPDSMKVKHEKILEEEEVQTAKSPKERFKILSLSEEPCSVTQGQYNYSHFYKTYAGMSQDVSINKTAEASTKNSKANSEPTIPTVVILSSSQERDTELTASTSTNDSDHYSMKDWSTPPHDRSGLVLVPRRQISVQSETTSGYASPSSSLTSSYHFGIPSSPVPVGQSQSSSVFDPVYEEEEGGPKADQGIGLDPYKVRQNRRPSLVSRRSRWPWMSDYSTGRVDSPDGSTVSSQCTSGYYSQQSLMTRMGSQDSFDERERYRDPPSRSHSLSKRDHCSTHVNRNRLNSPTSRSHSFH